jgi:hypothetical protein
MNKIHILPILIAFAMFFMSPIYAAEFDVGISVGPSWEYYKDLNEKSFDGFSHTMNIAHADSKIGPSGKLKVALLFRSRFFPFIAYTHSQQNYYKDGLDTELGEWLQIGGSSYWCKEFNIKNHGVQIGAGFVLLGHKRLKVSVNSGLTAIYSSIKYFKQDFTLVPVNHLKRTYGLDPITYKAYTSAIELSITPSFEINKYNRIFLESGGALAHSTKIKNDDGELKGYNGVSTEPHSYSLSGGFIFIRLGFSIII